MTHAKLFVLNLEIPLLSTNMRYSRSYKEKGSPTARIYGGKITVCFETSEDTTDILRWMTRTNGGESAGAKNKMEKGKICFYENGYDQPPTKTYEFNDAHLVDYRERMHRDTSPGMQTTITISPAIQNYGAEHIKPWNISYVEPVEEVPHQPLEIVEDRPKIYDTYFEDLEGNRITELKIGTEVYLVVASENVTGKSVEINLSDKNNDFIHKGERLEDDILKNLTISGDIHKEKLTVTAQHH